MKTNRGAAKRFRATGGGKVRRGKAYRRHILTTKTRKQKRHLRKATTLVGPDAKSIRRLMPYL